VTTQSRASNGVELYLCSPIHLRDMNKDKFTFFPGMLQRLSVSPLFVYQVTTNILFVKKDQPIFLFTQRDHHKFIFQDRVYGTS